MNILHHKSWHVRNRDNIERVRKDEEKARLEEEEKAKRAALADQEARTSLLRARARTGSSKELASNSASGSEVVPLSEEPRHINFFQDIEEGLRQGTNVEYEAEKKAEQEKQEKAIGILTYLGQSATAKHGEHPWYLKKDKQKETTEDDKSVRDSKRKEALDPLNTMKKYLAAKESKKNKKHSKEHKKSKKKEEKHSKKKSIEELRAERVKRENAERTRERGLLPSSKGETTTQPEDNPYRYNSQFNPDLVRKPRNTTHQRYRPY